MKKILLSIILLLLSLPVLAGQINTGPIGVQPSNATETIKGIVELATDAETVTGTATDKVTTPANITAKMAAPGAIGDTTPAAGTFTSLDVQDGNVTNVGDITLDSISLDAKTAIDATDTTRITATATSVLTGSIDPIASTTVTGVNTLFTTELVVGDRITVTAETKTVTAITNDTSLTVNTAFSDNANDTSPDRLPAEFIIRDSSNNVDMIVQDNGNVGIGTTGPSYALDISATKGIRLTGPSLGEDEGIRIYTSNANANARNWWFGISNLAHGDFTIRQSNAIGGDPQSAGTVRLYIDNTGNVGINDESPSTKFDVDFANDTTCITVESLAAQADVTALDTFIDFRSATGSEGSVAGTASAGLLAYNTFTGSHYTQIMDKAGLEPNMLLEIVEGKTKFEPLLNEPERIEKIEEPVSDKEGNPVFEEDGKTPKLKKVIKIIPDTY